MLLEVDDLHAYYGSSHVLHGVALSVDEGEVLAVVGRNGMGKTTLIHTLAGIHPTGAGTITFGGKRIGGMAPERICAAGVTLVPQGHRVFRSLTVEDNLRVAVRERGQGSWTIDDVCDRFPVLKDRWGQGAGTLSGGQQQMLAIARALVGNGSLVLMDEPSEGLDPQRVALVTSVIEELRTRGTAVLLVEQKVAFVLDVANRVDVMSRGQVTQRSDAEALRADPGALPRYLGLA